MPEYTDDERKLVERIVTDPDAPTYFYTGNQPAELVGASMARTSRTPNDMRRIWIDEFSADGLTKTRDLIERVVSGYGDDSVQQLVPVQFVTERISNLLTKEVEHPRIGMAYLEQSTRYIFFDQKDPEGNWLYYTPSNLAAEMTDRYRAAMDTIFETYSELVHIMHDHFKLTRAGQRGDLADGAWNATTKAQACDAVRAMLPVATRSTVAFTGNVQSLENLIMHLNSLELVEAHDLANQLIEQARRLPYLAPFLQRVDKPERGLGTSAYRRNTRTAVHKLVADLLADGIPGEQASSFSEQPASVQLVAYEPVQESEILAWMIYPFVEGNAIDQLQVLTDQLSDTDVALLIETYIGERNNRRHKPNRGIERSHFWWEIVDEYASYRDLQRHRMVDAWQRQPLSTTYGYQIPNEISEAGERATTLYRSAFKRSEQLYQQMCDWGQQHEAQYATLLGHRMHYSFGTNLRELFHMLELRTQPAGHIGYRNICNEMYRQLSEAYPRFAAGMRFVNTTGETDELTRLSAERATELKLRRLDAI